jgi:AcrR family transcriptional regulator
MPKLDINGVLRNKEKIETAALQVFVKQGFHGTTIRDIANASGVSIGNIYTYYKTKEDLYQQIAENYEKKMQKLRQGAIEGIDDLFDPEALALIARRVKDIVRKEADYWRLMYIDITEFGNVHFAHLYRNLSRDLKTQLGKKLTAPRHGEWRGLDPALHFASIYLQFFTYFLVETLFGGRQHLGLPDDEAIEQMITLFARGAGLAPARPGVKSAKAGGKS